MAPLILYGMPPSAPVRQVEILLKVLGVDHEYKTLNLREGEQFKPEFLKLNPQHNVPLLKDGKFLLNESKAILTYIANVHDKEGKLYPKNAKERARVEQRLLFDMGTFYKAFSDMIYPILFGGMKELPGEEALKKKFKEVMGWANDFVKDTGYIAGTKAMSIADIALISSFSTIVEGGLFDDLLKEYTELTAWFERVKAQIPDYEEVNGKGAAEFGMWIKSHEILSQKKYVFE